MIIQKQFGQLASAVQVRTSNLLHGGGGRPRGSGGRRSKQQCAGVGQRTWKETRCMTEVENGQRHVSDMGEGEPWLLLAMFGHTFIILLPFNKNELHESRLKTGLVMHRSDL